MSNLTENAAWEEFVNKIENGEEITDALLNAAAQALANRTAYLRNVMNGHTSSEAPHSGHLKLNPPGAAQQIINGPATFTNENQEFWGHSAVISQSPGNNPGMALLATDASAIWLRHVRNNRRLWVFDDLGQLAPVSAKAATNLDDLMTLGQFRGVTLLADGTNINSLIQSGWYEGNSLLNRPSGTSWIRLMVIAHSSTLYAQQVAFDFFYNRMYIRLLSGGTWGGWTEVTNQATAQIGVGQTWQDVLSSRSEGVNYQNTTGRPIEVSMARHSGEVWEVFCGASTGSMISLAKFATVDPSIPISVGYSFIVPAGWYYRLVVVEGGPVSLRRWVELR